MPTPHLIHYPRRNSLTKTSGGVIGFVVLVLDIIVFSKLPYLALIMRSMPLDRVLTTTPTVEVLQSNRPPVSKLAWCVVVFFLPVVGMIVYWLFSNRQAHKSGSYEPLA